MESLADQFITDVVILLDWFHAQSIADIFSDPLMAQRISRGFEQLFLMMPPSIRVMFYYFIEIKLWLYGLMALVGTVTFLVLIFMIATLSRERSYLPRYEA